jgi:hypothetical protein
MAKLEGIRIAILQLLTPNRIPNSPGFLVVRKRSKVKIIVRKTSDSSGGCAAFV